MKGSRYTEPKLVKGKKPTHIPKGSNLEKEWAKNKNWLINFSYDGEQVRIKGNLNRIKDHKEKAYQASVLLQSIKDDLAAGWNPHQPEAFYEKVAKENISLADAVSNYLADVARYSTRKKTVQSYGSKLRHLVEAFPSKLLGEITTKDIETYIRKKIHGDESARMFMGGKWVELSKNTEWTAKTVKTARGVFSAFFNWCKDENYITENPCAKIESKRVRSEVEAPDRHIPFKKEDMQTLMNYLDANDQFTALFGRIINSTCLRPAEISKLQLKDIDLKNKKITVPLAITKNTTKTDVDVIDIEPNLMEKLNELNLENYPKNYFLTSNAETIIGSSSIGSNRPYKRFRKALEKLNLHDKGYTLYSFKHYSNIERLKNGWTLTDLMKANRHSSIAMTEKYLKKIKQTTDISNKEVPKI